MGLLVRMLYIVAIIIPGGWLILGPYLLLKHRVKVARFFRLKFRRKGKMPSAA